MMSEGIPKDASALHASVTFGGRGSIQRSRSFVALGRAWTPTACPPMTRYRMRCLANSRSSEVKSGVRFMGVGEGPRFYGEIERRREPSGRTRLFPEFGVRFVEVFVRVDETAFPLCHGSNVP